MNIWRHLLTGLALALLVAPASATDTAVTPQLRVSTLDGGTFDLAAQRGHWVIVNFWATWCVPCIKEMPDISQFVATHKNVRAIGLAYEDSDVADIRAFLRQRPVVYPVAQVTLDTPLRDFATPRGLPTTYLIDPHGRVAAHIVGPLTTARLQAEIGGRP